MFVAELAEALCCCDSFFDSAAARFKTYLQAGSPAAVEIQIPDESNRVESGGQYAS